MVGGAEPAVPEHLEVGAQRGERRAQLVRGVGHEPALRALGRLERLEHRVERAREPRQLVVAGVLDPAREVARARDVLGGVGQLGHGPDRRARGQPREHQRGGDPGSTITREPEPERAERRVDLVERPRDLERARRRPVRVV